MSRERKRSLYFSIFRGDLLDDAWFRVRESGLAPSSSSQNRKLIKAFEADSRRKLKRLKKNLKEKRFEFLPSRGAPVPKGSSGHRPIVVQPVENRIVQRAILNLLQKQPHIIRIMNSPYSFGGLRGKSVKLALEKVCEEIKGGAGYYIRSDIKDFFTKIPRDRVAKLVCGPLDDKDFEEFFIKAINTELENLAELKELGELFPINEEGVAQGSCLSPLLANIYLDEFDRMMNEGDLACIRFMDDFVMLGNSEKELISRLRIGTAYLSDDGMELHDPTVSPDKAGFGGVRKGFEFLGCKVERARVTPSNSSMARILSRIEEELSSSELALVAPETVGGKSYLRTLSKVSNMTKGWLMQYRFCNDKSKFGKFDAKVSEMLFKYENYYRKLSGAYSKEDRCHLLGVTLSKSIEFNPIVGCERN